MALAGHSAKAMITQKSSDSMKALRRCRGANGAYAVNGVEATFRQAQIAQFAPLIRQAAGKAHAARQHGQHNKHPDITATKCCDATLSSGGQNPAQLKFANDFKGLDGAAGQD